MSLRALNMMETTRLGLPFGGTWRFRQEPVLGEHATKKGLILAWDTPSATKIFGIYQDYPKAELMQRLLALPAELRNCYEVIPKTDMCTGYAVLKWAGAPDPTHAVMHAALELLRLRCETQLHLQPDVCAYCGSHPHPDTGETQHVYHIIVQNLVFQDNHNGQMRSFFDLGMDEINLGVYTRNRQLLLPNCCPAGVKAPLLCVGSKQAALFVSGPELPSPTQILFDKVRGARWPPVLSRFLLKPAEGAGKTAEGAGKTAEGAGKTAEGAGRSADGAGRSADGAGGPADGAGGSFTKPADGAGRSLKSGKRAGSPGAQPPPDTGKKARVGTQPFQGGVVEAMLGAAGVQAALVRPPQMALTGAGQQQWTFQCEQGSAGLCLKCPAEKHAPGSFRVVALGGAGEFIAMYQCEHGSCWNAPDAVLGTIRFDAELQLWAHRLSPQFPLRTIDPAMQLPFPAHLLADLILKAGGLAADVAAVHYLADRSEWRIRLSPAAQQGPPARWINAQEDTILFAAFDPASSCFAVSFQCSVQGLPCLKLGTVRLTQHGVWAVAAEDLSVLQSE
jgi:hypothetical protein